MSARVAVSRHVALWAIALVGLAVIAVATCSPPNLADLQLVAPARAEARSLDINQVVAEYNELIALANANRFEEFIARAPAYLAKTDTYFDHTSDGYFTILQLIPDAYRSLGRWAEAGPYQKQILALYEKRLGPDARQIAGVLTELASGYRFDGRYGEAEQLQKRAVAICAKVKCLRTAFYVGSLGNLYVEMGRYAEAETLLTRAVSLQQKDSRTDPTTAEVVQSLANLYMALGRDEEAETLLKRAESILMTAKRGSDESPAYRPAKLGANLEYLAIIRLRQGRYAEVESLLKRAIALNESSGFFPEAGQSQLFAPLARAYLAQGRYAEAEPLLKRVLAIQEKIIGLHNRWVAENTDSLATVYTHLGRHGEAQSLFDRALASLDRSIGADHPDAAPVLNHYAALQLATGHVAEALELSRRSVRVAQAALSLQVGSAERIDLKRLRASFTTDLDALWRTHDSNTADTEIASEAFEVAQWASQSAAATALSQLAARLASGDDALAQIVRAQQDAAAERRTLDKTLLAVLSRPVAQRSDGRDQDLRKRITELDGRLAELNARIGAEFPDYASFARPQPLNAHEVQKLIGGDEALVSILVGDKDSHVFVLTRERLEWKTIPLGDEAMAQKVAAFRRGLEVDAIDRMRETVDKTRADKLFDLALAHELYGTLLGPVEALIKDKPHLMVVPSGVLTALPFNLLVTEKPAAAVPQLAGYRDAAWLIKRQAVSVLPSVASLKTLRGFVRKDQGGKPMVGFGDPVFDPREPKTAVAAQRTASRGVMTTRGYSGFWQGTGIDRAQLSRLPRLPETADELKTVAQQLGAPMSDLHLRADASEATVKRLPLADYRVVYFATHGLVAGDVEGLAEPSLALTVPARPTANDDGLLTASEVAQLKLNADWVVLSACNTIAGDKPGAEALSGLARAFFYAGARALLVSHWAVESAAATRLTTSTFDLLAREPKLGRAEALRRAMLAEMNDASNPRRAYPALWAPFVVVGEGAAR
jgi:CHAT domain-containing protein/Tfp pilus assembly protein PilF